MDLTRDLDPDEEMFFFRKGSKKGDAGTTKEQYKSKTEQKFLLAKQDPEPVFNLTDCNLPEVPSGVYSWCKVCRKEILLVQNNILRSLDGGGNFKDLYLLRVIDVHNNKLSKLPDAIGNLINLQALYLHFNQLKSLPDSLQNLNSLLVLNIKGNKFKDVPQVVCRLTVLEKLDISANVIRKLPSEFCNLKTLTTLVLDEENYVHPPRDICMEGLEAIMVFLCKENGVDYSPAVSKPADDAFSLESKLHYDTDEDSWTKVTVLQSQLQAAHSETEKSLQDLFDNLAQVAIEAQRTKHKFVEEIIQEKDRMDEELALAQNKKDVDKQRLLVNLVEVEKESEEALQELLEMNESRRNIENMLKVIEQERQVFEDLFMTVQNETVQLRRREVLEAMESILENQFLQSQLTSNTSNRHEWMEKAKLENVDLDRKLLAIVYRKDQSDLLSEISQEEEIQKRAFAALMMKRDTGYLHLTKQILLIEQELANLTLLEVRKKNLKMEFEKHILEEQRELLTKLLVQLMEQQENRKLEFTKRLEELETRRTAEQIDFWLLQYQRLMDTKPEQIHDQVKLLDAGIKEILSEAQAEDYIHHIANKQVSLAQFLKFDHSDLTEAGIKDLSMREAILQNIESYKSRFADEMAGSSLQPSAPPLQVQPQRQPSLRTRFETECVVCMDRQCTILFLNCGHVCCCDECGAEMSLCPLCRAYIERIVCLHVIDASAPPQED